MRILHYYPKDDNMIAGYVNMLVNNMGLEAENVTTTEETEAKEKLQAIQYDILHIHGCWRNSSSRILKIANRQGTRLVHSPYGQLEPWILEENYWKEKLPKRLLYQRHVVESAYAVIIQGRMEEECMRKLGWNHRQEIIRNPMITHSITPVEMARKTYAVYRKVLDSNTLERMSENTQQMLRHFIKAGITGDSRWITEELCTISDQEQWRCLLCYAHHEQIEGIVNRGIRILNYQAPDIDTSKVAWYKPDHYEPAKSIQDAIGLQFTSENERLLATFKHLRKLILRKRLTISHLCELDRELREHDVEEDHLCETLKEERLFKMAGRVMQLMGELTGLNEGLMPLPPLNDRITKQMKRQIHHHLKL
jgi:hypothetical protein